MGRTIPEIRLSAKERNQLEELIDSGVCRERVMTRARILLMADEYRDHNFEGMYSRKNINQTIADALQINKQTVLTICKHYVNGGLEKALYEKPRPRRPEIGLSSEDRKQLEELVSKRMPPRVKKRALILLMATEYNESSGDDGRRRIYSNQAIADILHIHSVTVREILKHFVNGGLEATLFDKPNSRRSINKKKEEVRTKLIMLASTAPPTGYKRWTLQLLADRMVELGYVDHMSDTRVSEILIRTNSDYRPSKGYRSSKEETESKLIMLARSEPPAGHERWTLKLLAKRMVELGYVNHMSDTWVSKVLKKANYDCKSPEVGTSRK